MARVPGETLEAEIRRLAGGVRLLDGIDAPRLQRVARTCLRSHEYLRLVYAARDLQAVRPAMALREELMYEHVRDALDAAPGEGLVLISHDFHLARDDRAIRRPSRTVGPGGDQVPSIGARLHGEHPGEILAVWMLEGRGHDASPVAGGAAR
jgi:hypothetical protein